MPAAQCGLQPTGLQPTGRPPAGARASSTHHAAEAHAPCPGRIGAPQGRCDAHIGPGRRGRSGRPGRGTHRPGCSRCVRRRRWGHLPPRSGRGGLPLHTHRGLALLHKAGLVDHENGAVGARVVADGIGVPAGVARQARPARAGRAPLVRPADWGLPPPGTVLPFDVRQQPEQAGAGCGPGLNSSESARDPGHDLFEHRPPAGRAYAVAVSVPGRVHDKIAKSDWSVGSSGPAAVQASKRARTKWSVPPGCS